MVFRKSVALLLILFSLTGCWSYISKEARYKFIELGANKTITVYPVEVIRGQDAADDVEMGQKLASFMNSERLGSAFPANERERVFKKWRTNEARLARENAEAFSVEIKKKNITTDYAMLAQIFCNARETRVIGVHYYICDRDGVLAEGGFTNSHWTEFKTVNPADRRGGLEVLKLMLLKRWKGDLGHSVELSFKGMELYSWKPEGEEWRFSLLDGTNRMKTEYEIKAAFINIDELKRRLARLGAGETVFLKNISGEAIPESMAKELNTFCDSIGIKLEKI